MTDNGTEDDYPPLVHKLTLREGDYTFDLYRVRNFVLCEFHTGLTADEDAFNAANFTLPYGYRPVRVINIPCFCDRTTAVRNVYVEQFGIAHSVDIVNGQYTSGRLVWYTNDDEPSE